MVARDKPKTLKTRNYTTNKFNPGGPIHPCLRPLSTVQFPKDPGRTHCHLSRCKIFQGINGMWRSCLTIVLLASWSHAFVPIVASSRSCLVNFRSSSTATDYDIVKVDLSDGRDYPIYIGAGFSDEEGLYFAPVSHPCRQSCSHLFLHSKQPPCYCNRM